MLKAVFFDLDDTLLETHEAHQAALSASCALAAERHPEWTADALARVFSETFHRLEVELEAGRLNLTSQLLYRTLTWEETLRSCGLPLDLGAELARVYLDRRREQYRLYEEVPALLDELASRYRLVLVTNGLSDLQREKVAAVRLERWITRIAVSGELGSWKPDPGIFRHALELAEVSPDEAVMVGDNLAKDVGGAASVGIRTVWVRRYAHLVPIHGITPTIEVPHLRDLSGTLAQLSAA